MGIQESMIKRKKARWDKLLGKGKISFEELYDKAQKRGELAVLFEFLEETGRGEEFVKDEKCCLYRLFRNNEGDLHDFALRVGIAELSKQYGTNLKDKLEELKERGKIHYMDIYQLLVIPNISEVRSSNSPEEKQSMRKKQETQLCGLLDLFTNDTLEVGIHRTGGNVSGSTIQEEGLFLTGDITSGVVKNDVDLERNISFYDDFGLFIRGIVFGTEYKNYGEPNVDIILVGIPRGERKQIEKKLTDIKQETQEQAVLPTEYIVGYATVSASDNIIERLEIDEKEIGKVEEGDTNERGGTVETQLGTCADIAIKPENYGIVARLMSCLRSLGDKSRKIVPEKEREEE